MRVVSLIPAATEIVCAVGRRGALVGRSHECDHPPGVEGLPAVTEPKHQADGTSYGIDESVRALLQEGLSVYRVDAAALDRLRPDVIVTQDQCRVCAASPADVEAAVRELVDSAPRIVSLSPASLDDVFRDVRRVGRELGAEPEAEGVVDGMLATLQKVARRVGNGGRWGESEAGGAEEVDARPTVAVIEWMEPLMAAGNWIPELVERAGGRALFGRPGAHSPWLAWEEVRAANPEVVIVVPCGFTLDRTRRELDLLTGRPGFGDLRAARSGRVYLADGHHFFNRPGPRLAQTAEILGELLHPGRFEGRWEGVGWEQADIHRTKAEAP